MTIGWQEKERERASLTTNKVRTPVVVLAGTISVEMGVLAPTVAILTQNGIVIIVIQPHALPPLLGHQIIVVETVMDLAGEVSIPLAEAKLDHRLLQHLHLFLRLTTGTTPGETGKMSGRLATRSSPPQRLKTVSTTQAYCHHWRK